MPYRSMVRGLFVLAMATTALSGAAWAQIVTPQFVGPLTPVEHRGAPSWYAPTAAMQLPLGTYVGPTLPPQPMNPGSGPPFHPSQVQTAYGVTSLAGSADGAGMTIAIVDAYNYPNALTTLNTFSSTFGLPQFNTGGPTFTQLNESGGTALPGVDTTGGSAGTGNNWELEEALDMEWAHAMAPKANIILYEGNSSSYSDLQLNAVVSAKNNAAVSVVSMSFGGNEFSGETSYDTFTTPSTRLANHQGVTFVASAGDNGAYSKYAPTTITPQFPAASSNVVAVGGTNLTLNANDNWTSETTWGSGATSGTAGGGGGGVSSQYSKPTWQVSHGTLLATVSGRAYPDVSMVAAPATGVYVYDSYNGGWWEVGGTSLAAPLWSGLIADADELRSAAGHGTLDGPSQTLPGMYSLSSNDFHDITTGNNGYAAGPGYDLATGLGTPIANLLVPDLANYATVNSTSYSLTAAAAAVKIHVATAGSYATTSITGSIANTGTSGANSDSLTFGGFGLAASGGTLSGGTLPLGAGTLAASSGTSGTATFSSNTAGSFTITPTAVSVANLSAGGTPTLSSTATTVTVYRLAAPTRWAR